MTQEDEQDKIAYGNFKKQILELADERLNDAQIKGLWAKLPRHEQVFFLHVEPNAEQKEQEEINTEKLYDGLKKSDKHFEINDMHKDEDFYEAVQKLPVHFLGSVKKQDCGYKANVFRNSIKNEILKVKTLEVKQQNKKLKTPEEIEEEKNSLFVYNMPAFNYNNQAFKNYLLYTYYGNDVPKQAKYANAKTFFKKNKINEGHFTRKLKSMILMLILNQDSTITTDDAVLVVEGILPLLDVNDYEFLYKAHIKPTVY